MDIVLLPQHWASIVCICIMIGALIFGILKKYMIAYILIISNIIIFIITLIYYDQIVNGLENDVISYAGLGFRPAYLSIEYFPQTYTLFTSMFIHGGFAHIFGNMFVFFFVGSALEERISPKNFLIIYLITGVAGTLTHSFLNLGSWVPLIGASGAIFGVMGALAFAFPRDEVVMPVGIGIMFLTKIKVIYAVIFFAVIETIVVALDVQDTTAHFAHLGGLLAGLILAAILIKRKKTSASLSYEPIYYNEYDQSRKGNFISNLKQLADTPELKEMLNKIEKETVAQVRDIWIDHFLDKTVCPNCKAGLKHFDGKIWCDKCGFKTEY